MLFLPALRMRREQLVVGVVFALCCVLFLVRDRIAVGGLLSSSASAAALRGGDTDWEPDLSASPALLCNGVLKWGEARGVLSSSVACADIDVGGGVVIGGLVATKNILEKEVVMSVPKGSLVGAWAVHAFVSRGYTVRAPGPIPHCAPLGHELHVPEQ